MPGLEDLYREIILDHYRNPRNRGELETPPAHRVEGFNPLCGDEIVVYLDVNADGVVDDIRISGQGCSISQSSASMMSSAVKGKTIEQIRAVTRAFKAMMSIHESKPSRATPTATISEPLDASTEAVTPRRPRSAPRGREVPGAHQVRNAGLEHAPAGARRICGRNRLVPGPSPENRRVLRSFHNDGPIGPSTASFEPAATIAARFSGFGNRVIRHGVALRVSGGEYATDTGHQEDEMDQAGIVTLIDEALKRFAGRDLVSSNEVLDLLLDMRTAAVSDAAIAALDRRRGAARALSVTERSVRTHHAGRTHDLSSPSATLDFAMGPVTCAPVFETHRRPGLPRAPSVGRRAAVADDASRLSASRSLSSRARRSEPSSWSRAATAVRRPPPAASSRPRTQDGPIRRPRRRSPSRPRPSPRSVNRRRRCSPRCRRQVSRGAAPVRSCSRTSNA